jgi:peptidoglycan/xylan/chitin deacetylase (PgdA/CDA1 family)
VGSRDLIGRPGWARESFERIFGVRRAGDFRQNWPDGVRMAVLLTFDTQGDIDALRGAPNSMWQPGKINFCDLTMRRFDVKEGVHRVLRILGKHGVKATFPVCGMTAEWYPEIVRDIRSEGHEIAAHGYSHEDLYLFDDEGEAEEIRRATECVADAAGIAPIGWRCPRYSITERTLGLLREAGYLWDSDLHESSFPYVLEKNGDRIVEIPAGLDDWGMYLLLVGAAPHMGGTPYGTPEQVLSTVRAEFDVLYEESENTPQVMQWCMHPKITGRPFRAQVLDALIEHAKGHSGVWFATCEEIARLA